MTKNKITIIGAGCIGTSIGLALKGSRDAAQLDIAGHDREHSRARHGVQAGAFDSAPFNLDIALTGASLVIVAVPLAHMRPLLEDIGALIEPTGVVITDTAPLKVPVQTWARDLLPPGVHYVGGAPLLAPDSDGWQSLEGPAYARADLFQDAIYAITADASAHPSAVRTVHNLAITLGAVPYFMDAAEHDDVRTTVHTVPDMIATAIFDAVQNGASWPEARKIAGRAFATATAAAYGDAESRRMMVQLNKDSVVRGLDTIIERLNTLRQVISSSDVDTLDKTLRHTKQERDVWLLQASERAWEPAPQTLNLPAGGLFDRTVQSLLGERISGSKPPKQE